MHLRHALLGLILLIGLASAFKPASPPREERKQLAGPPSEFASMVIPSPEAAALRADSSMRPFTLIPSRNGQIWTWEGTYPVDTRDKWTLSIASPFEEDITVYLAPPGGEYFQLVDSIFNTPDSIAKKSSGPFGIDGNTVPTTSYTFYDPAVGSWSILLNSSTPINQKPGLPHGYLILDNESNYKLLSHLNSYELEEGQELGLVIRMYEETPATRLASEDLKSPLPSALQGVISVAEMEVILPDGNLITVEMKDDGLSYDLGANDGVYGAAIEATALGQYTFTAQISGTSPEGLPFVRTTKHLIQVVPPQMTLTGLAASSFSKKTNVMSFYLDVDVTTDLLLDDEKEATVIAYAQVWGSNAETLEYVPVAWVQAIAEPIEHDTLGLALQLDLNADWIKLAGAYPPFQLRGATLQDLNTNGLLSARSEIFVESDSSVSSLGTRLAKLYTSTPNLKDTITVTEEMKWGPRPTKFALQSASNETQVGAGGALLLVHGYCSGPVWPKANFTNAEVFEDYTQSRSQDEFAKLILAFGNKLALSSYSIAGHSQGGLASLHLKTYYWSGLDTSDAKDPAKLIQSVGSPYLGCSLAGSLADIGSVFGVGCASNVDLSVNGAQLWASKIPADMRKYVSYYLTMYDDKTWLGSACVTGSSMVMYSPNDGTCEERYGKLEGATSMGMNKGECHVTDMKYPAQCHNGTRNAKISEYAPR